MQQKLAMHTIRTHSHFLRMALQRQLAIDLRQGQKIPCKSVCMWGGGGEGGLRFQEQEPSAIKGIWEHATLRIFDPQKMFLRTLTVALGLYLPLPHFYAYWL